MSTIGSEPRIDRAGLEPLLDRVLGEDLRQRSPETHGEQAQGASRTGGLGDANPGEAVLMAPAWDGVPQGQRMLAGDHALQSGLGGLDLSAAAERGAEGVAAALA